MKIFLICLLGVLFFSSCKSESEKLILKGKEHLINSINDPSSFELIESSIIDTVKKIEILKKQREFWVNRMNETNDKVIEMKKLIPDYTVSDSFIIKFNVKVIDSLQNLISVCDSTKVDFIALKYKYRAKNKFGALVIEESVLRYNPETSVFE